MLLSYYSNGVANPDLVHPSVTKMNPDLDLSPLNRPTTTTTTTNTTSTLKTRPLEVGEHQYLEDIHSNVIGQRNAGSYSLATSKPVVPKSESGVGMGTTLGVGAGMGATGVRSSKVAPAPGAAVTRQPRRSREDGWEMDDLDERLGSGKSSRAANGNDGSGDDEVVPSPFWAIGTEFTSERRDEITLTYSTLMDFLYSFIKTIQSPL